MAGKLSIDATIWSNLDDLPFFLIRFSVREGSAPADQPDPRKNIKMHHDSYELISCTDGPLSTQIRYVLTSFESRLFWKHSFGRKNKMECKFVWLPLRKSGCLHVNMNEFYGADRLCEGKSGLCVAEPCGKHTYSQVGQIQLLWHEWLTCRQRHKVWRRTNQLQLARDRLRVRMNRRYVFLVTV